VTREAKKTRMRYRFLDTGFHSGAFNMELDESLVRSLAEGTGSATVRVYGWSPPAISLGWNQRIDEVDVDKAKTAGIGIVRRPTGGRAILHSEELTYSVVTTASSKNILAVYSEISLALVRGLNRLGVHASLEKSQPHFPSLYHSPSSMACFSSSARYEIHLDGRKLVGSAQRRYAGSNGEDVVLQQGSLLLGAFHRKLVDFLKIESALDRSRLVEEMEDKTTDVSESLGRVVTFAEAAEAVKFGFEEAWGIKFESGSFESVIAGVFS